jgi:hypothetical protein
MSSCNFHVVLYLYSGTDDTSPLLWDYAAMKAVWDHTRSFLRHHCRLSFALTGACDIIVVHCSIHADLWLNCHLPTPVGSCCFLRRSSERPKLVSILAASLSSYDIIVVVARMPLYKSTWKSQLLNDEQYNMRTAHR